MIKKASSGQHQVGSGLFIKDKHGKQSLLIGGDKSGISYTGVQQGDGVYDLVDSQGNSYHATKGEGNVWNVDKTGKDGKKYKGDFGVNVDEKGGLTVFDDGGITGFQQQVDTIA